MDLSFVDDYRDEINENRRYFHKYPEPGFSEYNTTYRIIKDLTDLGYEVSYGRGIIEENARMGLPAKDQMDLYKNRAIVYGADRNIIDEIKNGFTGVVAKLHVDSGKIKAFRFDIDCVGISESRDHNHIPYKLGFSSVHQGACHSCGHDAHITTGLAFAKALMEMKDKLKGTYILIFQPAEEGVRGARAIINKGLPDNVDYIIGGHFGIAAKDANTFVSGCRGFLATRKFDVKLHGKTVHAGNAPEKGNNVLLAAASIITNLYAIPRHSSGRSRINVGKIEGGSFRSVIPDKACLEIEVRGENNQINSFMFESAKNIIEGACRMHNVSYDIEIMGEAISQSSSPDLVNTIQDAVEQAGIYDNVEGQCVFNGSEDFTFMMKHVKDHGGQAAYISWGVDNRAEFHNAKFYFDEDYIIKAVKSLCAIAERLDES